MLGIFLDIETTGLDPLQHHALELGIKVVNLVTMELCSSYEAIIRVPVEVWENRDLDSIAVNGFTLEQVEGGRDLSEVGKEVIALLQKEGVARGSAIFICQNPAFDKAFFLQFVDVYTQERLKWPYHWLDLASMFWARHNGNVIDEYHLSKNAIANYYGIPPEQNPHRAMNGVDHLISCYEAVMGAEVKLSS